MTQRSNILPALLLAAFILYPSSFILSSHAAPTVSTDPKERVAYAANGGWVNWRWDTGIPGEGATIADKFCWGRIYAANLGWITLGDGAPDDGQQYSQVNGDIGVNHDGLGRLSGWAYAANFGWINFGDYASYPQWTDAPFLDLLSGQLSGRVYSANLGWIDLGSSGLVFVVTTLDPGPDTDADMIPDWWEIERVLAAGLGTGTIAGDLMLLSKTTNADLDKYNDFQEWLADTDPFDDQSQLRITSYNYSSGIHEISFTSSDRRIYDFQTSEDLTLWNFEMAGIQGFAPENFEMFSSFTFPEPPKTYSRIIARRPLASP